MSQSSIPAGTKSGKSQHSAFGWNRSKSVHEQGLLHYAQTNDDTNGPYQNTTVSTASQAVEEKFLLANGSSRTIIHTLKPAQNHRYNTIFSGNENYGGESSSRLGNKPSQLNFSSHREGFRPRTRQESALYGAESSALRNAVRNSTNTLNTVGVSG